MSSFLVSARKYRPANFDTVVGQPAISNTLKSAIRSGQVAHAYLFCGPRGVGKTTCARIFAKTLNCFNLGENMEACDQCESCKSFNESRSFNIHELDAASNNSVDDIRSLIDKVRILPQVGKYSIYIIDEVHMLSSQAFNAFLKTLEEPPAHAIFILATTEKHKIIPTILSRCQIFDFHRIRVEDIVHHLAHVAQLEGIQYEEEALNVIALKADGAMRDALSIFDQVASFSQKNISYAEVLENLNVLDYEYYFRMTDAFLKQDASAALLLFDEVLQRGFDGLNFMGGLASHFRDLLVCQDNATVQLLEVSESIKARYRQQTVNCPPDFLFRALSVCDQCELSFKASKNQRLHVEIALIRLCNLQVEKKNLNSEQQGLNIPEIQKIPEKPVSQVPPPVVLPATRPVIPENPVIPRISIKDALMAGEKKEIVIPVAETQVPQATAIRKPLSQERLVECWSNYALSIKEEKPRMAVTLKNIQPELNTGESIVIHLNNRDQLEDFNHSTKGDLENFLRREMENDLVTIEALLSEPEGPEPQRLYTSEEKFKYLSQKNPALSKLRQHLNLELE